MTKIYIIAGEASGDFMGGKLIVQLLQVNPDIKFFGIGGPLMQATGLTSLFPISQINLMGFFEILPHIFRIKKLIRLTAEDINKIRPNVLITIDSPGFTYRVAKLARKSNPHLKMIHLVAPSVWAYKPGRAKKYAAIYNHLLALLPFEPPYFTKEGLPCTYIGHPILEQQFYRKNTPPRMSTVLLHGTKQVIMSLQSHPEMSLQSHPEISLQSHPELGSGSKINQCSPTNKILNQVQDDFASRKDDIKCAIPQSLHATRLPFTNLEAVDKYTICVTVGSRKGEILRHTPVFIAAINIMAQKYSRLRVIFALSAKDHQKLIEDFLQNANFDSEFTTDRLKAYADANIALAKSGTNTLEIAASKTPMIIAYKVNFLSYLIIRMMIKIKYISLINIIVNKEILPEFIQYNCSAEKLAAGLIKLLENPNLRKNQVEKSVKILHSLGFNQAISPIQKAVEVILGM